MKICCFVSVLSVAAQFGHYPNPETANCMKSIDLDIPTTKTVYELFQQAIAAGYDRENITAISRLFLE